MHRLEVTAWIARLSHLLVTERYGFSHVRLQSDVPVAVRTRTARHLARQGPDAIAAIVDAWPAVQALPIWPDFQRALERPDPGLPPLPMARRGFVDSAAAKQDDPLTQLRHLLHRLAYLHDEEEFQDGAFGFLVVSEAWRACLHDIVNPFGNLLEAYLDSRSATVRLIVRFCLRNHRVLEDWRTIDDHQLFERFAAAMDRQPDLLAAAPWKQIDRLRRAGALSINFTEGLPFPLARVPSGHFDLHPPALVTMSPLLR